MKPIKYIIPYAAILVLIFALFFIFIIPNFNGNAMNNNIKENEAEKIIKLPKPVYKGTLSVEECLLKRRSVRQYKNEPLAIREISQILWSAYGITKPLEGAPPQLRGGLRAAPSAGALYPLELYLVSGDVEGLAAGIYKYNSQTQQLNLIKKGDWRKELCAAALDQVFIENAPASIVYSAVYERTTSKYGRRGKERYVCMDLGHSAQNVYLQAVAMGIGTCGVGAFTDSAVKKVVQMPDNEEPLYIMPLGRLRD